MILQIFVALVICILFQGHYYSTIKIQKVKISQKSLIQSFLILIYNLGTSKLSEKLFTCNDMRLSHHTF